MAARLQTWEEGTVKKIEGLSLKDVQAVYSGPEGQLWELLMGEQIHLGGLTSSMQLAEAAGIREGSTGVDFCSALGAGVRFLLRFRKVARMYGVDATPHMQDEARRRIAEEGLAERVELVLAEVTNSGLRSASVDFAWGEDAWCYVEDKPKLIAEAARAVKPGGVIAFTDWVEGKAGLTDAEAERFLRFMKFPNIQDLQGYPKLLEGSGCRVLKAVDTGRFGPCVDLYLNMVGTQLTYDALRIIGFDQKMLEGLAGEFQFIGQLAHAGKIAQGLFVARKW